MPGSTTPRKCMAWGGWARAFTSQRSFPNTARLRKRAAPVRASLPPSDLNDVDDITRFNESIDQSLARAVSSYTERLDQSRQMFLAILSHDLRNPLNCIRMAAQLVSRTKDDPDSVEALSMIETNTEAMTRLIGDLIDYTLSGLGRTMPLSRGPVDLNELCREVVDGYRTTHPGRTLRFHSDGDVTGVWDAGRLRQIIVNLIGNAIQHGSTQGADRSVGGFRRIGFSGIWPGRIHRGIERP